MNATQGEMAMSKLLEILCILKQNEQSSQRDLSRLSDLSIGKINQLIKEAECQGFVNVARNQMKHKYELTKKGMDELERFLTQKNEIKIPIPPTKETPIKTAVILAAGRSRDYDHPAAFIKIDDQTTLIERTISLLLENEIENIVIVTGYQQEIFKNFAQNHPKIKLIKNDNYQHSGTMTSLAIAKNYIFDDFLLLESDIIFESRAIKKILAHPERDCMIITNESGSKDEALVEIRNNYIYNMTKDKHQLNKIDGEMIGITKISIDMYQKMLTRFADNKNPYLNYEYMLMDIGRTYKIGFEKIGDLVWWEFDTKAHLETFKKDIYRRLQHREKEWHEKEVKETIAAVLGLRVEKITGVDFVGGMTNTSYKITIDNKDYIARIPGAGTREMINRINEQRNCIMANELNLDAKIIYIDAKNGVKVAEFIENAETLTAAMTKRADVMDEVVKLLKTLHHCDTLFENDFDVFEEIKKYEILIQEANGYLFKDYKQTKTRVMNLKETLNQLGCKRVACHNDTGFFNILKDHNERYYLIDWEYSGNNDPIWDLAAHCLESEFTKEEEAMLLKKYFQTKNISQANELKLLIFQICQDFLWSIWTCIKEAKGNDFGTYGIDRYERAKAKLDELDAKLQPKD